MALCAMVYHHKVCKYKTLSRRGYFPFSRDDLRLKRVFGEVSIACASLSSLLILDRYGNHGVVVARLPAYITIIIWCIPWGLSLHLYPFASR